ncbi:MAG: c-type cytochrome [Woeseiaceae bacterium]|nr:c-type cytochrome [Woeseiaceae bacterium]
MKIRIVPSLVAAALALAVAPATAQSLIDGDAEAGKAKSVTCTACHGPQGNSSTPQWPNLAGQNARYLAEQLKAFKDPNPNDDEPAKRYDPLMTGQAMLLSNQDIYDLAVYFESLPGAAQAVANPATVARAEAIYRGGLESEGVPACLACHGPTGRGNPAAGYPALNGQHAAYTAKQLRDYASGARRSDDPTNMMSTTAERLSEADIKALASYVQGLK